MVYKAVLQEPYIDHRYIGAVTRIWLITYGEG